MVFQSQSSLFSSAQLILLCFSSGFLPKWPFLTFLTLIKVPVPRPLRIPESGEIRLLFSFRSGLGAVSVTSVFLFGFSITIFVVFVRATNDVVFFFRFSAKMAVSDVSQKYDVILRIF